MSKRDSIDAEDQALFRAAVADVTPLPQERVLHRPPAPPARKRRGQGTAKSLDDLFSDLPAEEPEPQDELLFCRPGLQHRVIRRLRRGQIPVGAVLDLHGLRVVEARLVLSEFLHHALAERYQVVRIIHGKGKGSSNRQPVLKGRVDHWLRQRPEVLAYCSAQPGDGGTGAIYVLLRRTHTPI